MLQQAYDGSTVDLWWYYLVGDVDYAAIPRRDRSGPAPTGTEAPISKSFKSPFIGNTVRDVATWLSKMPDDVYVDRNLFAVLDKKAKQGSVVLCRIGDSRGRGDELSCTLEDTEDSSLTLSGLMFGSWVELLENNGEYEPEYEA